MDEPTNGETDRLMDGGTNGKMDGTMDGTMTGTRDGKERMEQWMEQWMEQGMEQGMERNGCNNGWSKPCNGWNNTNQSNLPSAIKPWLDLMLDLHPIQSETM